MIITLFVLWIISLFSAGAYCEYKIRKIKSDIAGSAAKFIAPGVDAEGKPTPSELALIVDEIGRTLGSQIAIQIQARLMQQAGVHKRLQNQATEGIVQDLATEQNPLLGAVLDRFPSLRKMAAKHPEAAMQVLGLVQGALAGRDGGGGPLGGKGSNPANGQDSFSL
jgi:hypothetical protein